MIKAKIIIEKITLVLFIFYSFMTTYQFQLYGSRMNGILLLGVALFSLYGINLLLIRRELSNIKFNWTDLWLLIFILSVPRNMDLMLSTESRWILPMMGIFLMTILKASDGWSKNFIRYVKIMTFIHAFFTVLFYFFPSLYLDYFVNIFSDANRKSLIWRFSTGGMPGICSHYSTNGIYLAIGSLFCFSDVITKVDDIKTIFKKKSSILSILLFLFLGFALLLTLKRAHVFFVAFVVVCLTLFKFRKSKWMNFKNLFIFAVIGIVAIVILSFVTPVVGNLMNRFLNADGGGFFNGRTYFWEYAFKRFLENPIFGYGWGSFKHLYYDTIGAYAAFTTYIDAHNVYLQILCELGAVGLSVFLIILFLTLKNTLNMLCKEKFNNNICLYTSLAMQIFFILYCLTGNCLYDCEFFFSYILACGLTYAICIQDGVVKNYSLKDIFSNLKIK